MTTVAATVSIANAYTIDRDTDSGNNINIINNSDCHFILAANDAIKQARSFKLNVEIKDYNSFSAQATLEYGSYDLEGNAVKLGELVKNEVYSGDLESELFSAENVASGKFWLRAADQAYSSVTLHSISFFDENGNCILYGSADSSEEWDHKLWTFYQLESPEISVSGNVNPNGSYYYSAQVSARQADSPMLVFTDNGSNENACTWGTNISTVFKRNSETLDSDIVTFTEGGNNEYEYSAYTTATLTDTMNSDKTVTICSPAAETTVKLTDRVELLNPDAPVVVNESALTASAFEGRTAADILSAANAITGESNVTDGIMLGIDGLPDCRIVKIVDRDAAGAQTKTIYVPVTYTAVQGFDPAVRAEQTVALVGEADMSKLDAPTDYDSAVTVSDVKIASDYLTGVTLTPPTKTVYAYGETLDLTGGKLTLSYEHSQDAEIPLTDSKVIVTGDIYSLGTKTITVEYIPEVGEAKRDADLTETFEVTVNTAGTVAAPVFTPESGTFNAPFDVMISCATSSAKIFYTTDGSEPTENSTFYSGAFTVYENTTVKAIAVKENWTDSSVVSASYTMVVSTPEISPNGGEFSDKVEVTISCAIEGAVIHYTLDGTTPSTESALYTNPITITQTTTVKAFAVKPGFNNSEVSVAVFTLNTVPTPPTDGGGSNRPTRPSVDYTFNIIGGTEVSHTVIDDKVEFEFDKDSANKYATILKYDYTLNKKVFVDVVVIGADSKAVLALAGKGLYYVYIAYTTYLPGDMNNDGVLNELDAAAILNDIVGTEKGANPAMADFNGDGVINAFDAAEILKKLKNS